MNDLYYPSNREKFYHTSHLIKKLLRALQIASDNAEINDISFRLKSAIECIVELKEDDLNKADKHLSEILNLIEEVNNGEA